MLPLRPFWDIILTPFGSQFGVEGVPLLRGASIQDPFWNPFWVTFGTPLGPLWKPKVTQKAPKSLPASQYKGSEGGSLKRFQNDSICDPSVSGDFEIPSIKNERFYHTQLDPLLAPFGGHVGTFLGPCGRPRGPRRPQRGSKRGSKKEHHF